MLISLAVMSKHQGKANRQTYKINREARNVISLHPKKTGVHRQVIPRRCDFKQWSTPGSKFLLVSGFPVSSPRSPGLSGVKRMRFLPLTVKGLSIPRSNAEEIWVLDQGKPCHGRSMSRKIRARDNHFRDKMLVIYEKCRGAETAIPLDIKLFSMWRSLKQELTIWENLRQ